MNTAINNLDSRFLWFERGGKIFAVSMEYLYEVFSATVLRPVPGAKPGLAGLIVLRGQVLPVLDPSLLESPELPPVDCSPIVVVLNLRDRPCLGLLVEKVGKVVKLTDPAASAFSGRLWSTCSCQIKDQEDSKVIVLNAPALVSALGLADEALPTENVPASLSLSTQPSTNIKPIYLS